MACRSKPQSGADMSQFVVEELEQLAPEAIIARALSGNAGKVCITCSFQAEDMVVLHLLRKLLPDVAVVFLETGYHFPETCEYRDRMTKLWNLNLINAGATRSVAEQESQFE